MGRRWVEIESLENDATGTGNAKGRVLRFAAPLGRSEGRHTSCLHLTYADRRRRDTSSTPTSPVAISRYVDGSGTVVAVAVRSSRTPA